MQHILGKKYVISLYSEWYMYVSTMYMYKYDYIKIVQSNGLGCWEGRFYFWSNSCKGTQDLFQDLECTALSSPVGFAQPRCYQICFCYDQPTLTMLHPFQQIHFSQFLHLQMLLFCGAPSWRLMGQPVGSVFGPETKAIKDSTHSERLLQPILTWHILLVSWSSWEAEKVRLFCIPFKALCVAFFTNFIEVKYFLTSLARPILPPLLRWSGWSLLMVWQAWTLSKQIQGKKEN